MRNDDADTAVPPALLLELAARAAADADYYDAWRWLGACGAQPTFLWSSTVGPAYVWKRMSGRPSAARVHNYLPVAVFDALTGDTWPPVTERVWFGERRYPTVEAAYRAVAQAYLCLPAAARRRLDAAAVRKAKAEKGGRRAS
jgi:hypothetical protein